METLFIFELTRFRLESDNVIMWNSTYQMPARNQAEAIYKLGMTFNTSYPVESIEQGIELTKNGQGQEKAIIIRRVYKA